MSIEAVTARISEIEANLRTLSPAARTGSTSGAEFAAAMAATGTRTSGASGSQGIGALDGSASGGTAKAAEVIATAKKYLGIPYLWGGTDPDKGLDCSGFTQLVYKQHGIDLPRVSRDQARAGEAVSSMAEARPGDLIFFNRPVNHVAIYLGNGKMIESPRTGLNVRITEVPETPSAIRRVLPDGPVAGARSAGGGGAVSGVPYASLFNAAGAKHGVDPALLAAIAKQESGFRPDAVSHAGARGLMQLMPATARGLGVSDPTDPRQAVDGAARLMKDLLADFKRVDLALAAYNAGPGAVRRYDGIPPYAETQNYVRKVTAGWRAMS